MLHLPMEELQVVRHDDLIRVKGSVKVGVKDYMTEQADPSQGREWSHTTHS